MNRIQQLTDMEAAQDTQSVSAPAPATRVQEAVPDASDMPISRVVPSQSPDTEGTWVPVAFSSTVGAGMTTFQHSGQPWILFRDAEGNAACIEDCCAHRACPLSLVSFKRLS